MFWMCIRIASVRRSYYTSITYNFIEKYRKLSIFIILTPDFPHFYYILGGNLGSLLYGDVSVMQGSTVGLILTSVSVLLCVLISVKVLLNDRVLVKSCSNG